ncbi:MAG: hypothetical protein WBG01_17625 [Bacteroidota bacterium]
MKVSMMLLVVAMVSTALGGEITVKTLQGEVRVRHGVTEHWSEVAVGDVLRPNDSVRTGKSGSTILELAPNGSGRAQSVSLPPEVILDVSDMRTLTQEELMLKLTMEKVRSSSYQWKSDELRMPNAAVVHGQESGAEEELKENDRETGRFQLNGARVLYKNGFYSTCILRAMEVFRHYPSMAESFTNRLMVAEALVESNLRGEALAEYGAIARIESLSEEERALVRERMDAIKD